MHRLYELFKSRPEPPTQDEPDIASGQKKLNASAAGAYILKLEKASENIIEALQRQAVQGAVCPSKYLLLTSAHVESSRVNLFRKSLRTYLLNGLLHVTNHLMRWTSSHFANCSNMHTGHQQSHFIYPIEVRSGQG
jgi:hypothetical protein